MSDGSNVATEFAARIRTRRTELGWTRYELSKRCAARQHKRWHQTVINRFEDGQSVPSLVQAVVLCEVLGVTVTDLHLDPVEEPWLDGSPDTLAEIDDRVAGNGAVEVVDPASGAREVHAVMHEDLADLTELPEIPEEDR